MDGGQKRRHHGTNVQKEKPTKNGSGSRRSHNRTGSIQESKKNEHDSSSRRDKESYRPRKASTSNPVAELIKLYRQRREYLRLCSHNQ